MWMWPPQRRRPSPRKEAWMPKADKGPDPDADVPERLRGVKLTKRRARFVDTTGTAVLLVILLFLAGSFVLIHSWWERRNALLGD